jgi:hypothetical protein
MDVKRAGKLGRRLRQLIKARDWLEVERILHALPAEQVATYRFSSVRLTFLHLLAEWKEYEYVLRASKQAVERIARWLIRERGCEVDALDLYDMTPLWTAVHNHNAGVVRALLAAKANANHAKPVRVKPPRRYLTCRQQYRYRDWPQRISIHPGCPARITALLLDSGNTQKPRKGVKAEAWWKGWRKDRARLLSKVIVLLGVWSRRQPNATHGIDRHVMRHIVELLWRRRLHWDHELMKKPLIIY